LKAKRQTKISRVKEINAKATARKAVGRFSGWRAQIQEVRIGDKKFLLDGAGNVRQFAHGRLVELPKGHHIRIRLAKIIKIQKSIARRQKSI